MEIYQAYFCIVLITMKIIIFKSLRITLFWGNFRAPKNLSVEGFPLFTCLCTDKSRNSCSQLLIRHFKLFHSAKQINFHIITKRKLKIYKKSTYWFRSHTLFNRYIKIKILWISTKPSCRPGNSAKCFWELKCFYRKISVKRWNILG